MGRRPSAVKNLEKSYTVVKTQPENTNPSLEREDFPVKVFRVKLSPERIMEINPERSPVQERTNSQCEGGKKSAKSERKNPKYNKAAVRRSQRIQNALMHSPEPVHRTCQ
ncbi:hypothetical protein O6P43_010637 [Quillaja saponaria]|uniref:Uncharacterized protein n=1 Tax=Quillaja saponaria TaxID=32244 RepID=A0AAD7Q0U3_QUISA|nr:hypothetical protein O6P43_010637 [Quillaja saponaria]